MFKPIYILPSLVHEWQYTVTTDALVSYTTGNLRNSPGNLRKSPGKFREPANKVADWCLKLYAHTCLPDSIMTIIARTTAILAIPTTVEAWIRSSTWIFQGGIFFFRLMALQYTPKLYQPWSTHLLQTLRFLLWHIHEKMVRVCTMETCAHWAKCQTTWHRPATSTVLRGWYFELHRQPHTAPESRIFGL